MPHMYDLRITAQYYENIACESDDYDGTQESWRAKGGELFVIKMDSDQRMCWDLDSLEKIISNILTNISTKLDRYELVSFDFEDANPVDLTGDFNKEVERMMKSGPQSDKANTYFEAFHTK